MDKNKKRQLVFDIIITVLVVLVIVLIDFFVVSLRSSSGDFKEEVLQADQSQSINSPENSIITKDLEQIKPGEKVFIPILNFHHIDKVPANVSKTTASYYIEPNDFEMIMQNLIAYNYQTVFLSEVIDLLEQGIKPPDNWLVLTFDDGNINYYTNAWPILQKYNLKSSIYIMTGVGGENYLSDEQIKELSESSLVEVGSHTIYHPKLTQISKPERLKELEISKDELEELLNTDITILSYPFGLYNQEIKDLAKAVGYKAGLTFDQDAWQDPQDLFELKRISVWPQMNVVKFLEKLKN
ncbi:MAG: polysaccharide deacetylase family protein [Candidatus Buchananbacteria bacterium]|nr:polysaccharide deacetylase family protein [Candidatus Buchananbacteria bacterium]